jgi:hypothetical protein
MTSVRWTWVIAATLVMAGCGGSAATTDTTTNTATAPSAAPAVRVPQPFRLFTHCGILTTYFAGRTFYLEALDPSRVVNPLGDPLGNPFATGSMTLLSPHLAEFTDVAGHRIRFVDYLPGEVDRPYALTVLVISGGNHLADVSFAGRRWHTTDTLPGVVGPPYGNGMDAYTQVPGTMTLLGDGDARFTSAAGAVARFSPLPPAGCD